MSTSYAIIIVLLSVLALCAAISVAKLFVLIGFELPKRPRGASSLDGLRGFLALAVVFHHFVIWLNSYHLNIGWRPPAIHFFNQLGSTGVAIFFMITGYLFYPVILKGFFETAWLPLYLKRFFRIIPLVALSLIVVCLVIGYERSTTLSRNDLVPLSHWLAAWSQPPLMGYQDSGRVNAYVFWSLKYEWIFYFSILPVCALMMSFWSVRYPTWILPGALLLVSLSLSAFSFSGIAFRFFPLFFIGMIAHECSIRPSIADKLASSRVAFGSLLLLLTGMFLFPYAEGTALIFTGQFFIIVACGNNLFGALSTSSSRLLGEISFGIYLFHGIVFYIFMKNKNLSFNYLDLDPVFSLIPLIVLVVVIGILANMFVEKVFIQWGRAVSDLRPLKISLGFRDKNGQL
ncbi:hypothetical protein ASG63_23645 [Methylobacterium sp. Leaf94]|uniref:acyltransferase family protein n=1 Tax=Methylobacterium sp. Leaf94 TaxID=1736250 RepID=UPI0007138F50|nr:acyltransferase [Methylobacterium sp. Leaf94]KQU18826.1 hypothetical protein ASG63_23645 [Methylobacterium sp. Leaf94]